jgi:hypothetical protein
MTSSKTCDSDADADADTALATSHGSSDVYSTSPGLQPARHMSLRVASADSADDDAHASTGDRAGTSFPDMCTRKTSDSATSPCDAAVLPSRTS